MAALFTLDQIEHPIVQAPMGGGVSTPELAAAVSQAGGLGFLAAAYKTPEGLREAIAGVRELTDAPFGVNLFMPPGDAADPAALRRYATALEGEARRYGAQLGEPRHHDDGYREKLDALAEARVAVASFTFGCPERSDVEALHERGVAVWITVTSAAEARLAEAAGADALVVQGVEAGGHQASFDDDPPGIGLLALLQLVEAASGLPLVAAGGIATGRGVAAVLVAGAAAAQLGSAFMLTPEATISETHRKALEGEGRTALTRAFTGRSARGIENRFMRDHEGEAERGYPEVHHLTAPLRAAARESGDPDGLHLWAGQAYELADASPAAELVARLASEAEDALRTALQRDGGMP